MPDFPPPRILITAPYGKTMGPQITAAARSPESASTRRSSCAPT